MSQENAYFIVEHVMGQQDLTQVKRQLDQLHGVSSVSVDKASHLVAVDYDSSGVSYDDIEGYLNRMGYQIAADASCIHTR